jgi:hypothetical protein
VVSHLRDSPLAKLRNAALRRTSSEATLNRLASLLGNASEPTTGTTSGATP